MPAGAKLVDRNLTFSLNDPLWNHLRAVITGLGDNPQISVDGRQVQRVDELESQEECWARSSSGLTLLKVKQGPSPRHVEIRF
jgi:hypothetical protein